MENHYGWCNFENALNFQCRLSCNNLHSNTQRTIRSLSRDNPPGSMCCVRVRKDSCHKVKRKDDCSKRRAIGLKVFLARSSFHFAFLWCRLRSVNINPCLLCVPIISFMTTQCTAQHRKWRFLRIFLSWLSPLSISDFIDMQNKEFPSSSSYSSCVIMHENLFHFGIINPIDFFLCRLSFLFSFFGINTTKHRKVSYLYTVDDWLR